MSLIANLYVGMDVHKDSVMVAVFPEEAEEPTIVKRLPNEDRKLRRFFDRQAKESRVKACYEASGAGYVLQRAMADWGHDCEVVAPSLTPQRPGERRKHDRRDAIHLARQYRAGELVVIRVPTEAEERVRDLVRCRETFQREILKSRHYLRTFLARRGFVYREGSNWTQRHMAWIHRLLGNGEFEGEDLDVVAEYLWLLDYKVQRRDELDRQIEKRALEPGWRAAVERLSCFRGIATQTAMVLATEIGDWRRFERPGQLMAYVGLVPSERSSGTSRRLGAITKAGNSRCRHVLVQAAWSYRRRPHVGQALKERQKGQPPGVVAHSWKAQQRLHKVFRRIEHKKNSRLAVVAVARELVGFLWAVMRDLENDHTPQAAA